MKRKFSNPAELQDFFLSQLKDIVGVGGHVDTMKTNFSFRIIPDGIGKCLCQPTLQKLFKFFTKYELHYYIDFELGYLRVYTDEHIQTKLGRL